MSLLIRIFAARHVRLGFGGRPPESMFPCMDPRQSLPTVLQAAERCPAHRKALALVRKERARLQRSLVAYDEARPRNTIRSGKKFKLTHYRTA